jgi:DNA-binding beta-propeller fold protein YncE
MSSVQVLGTEREGRLRGPINVAVDADGTRYVTDATIDRVMVYDPENRYVRAIGSPDDWKPAGILIVDRLLYVTDVENGQVVVLEKETGEELRRFPDPDEVEEQFLLFKPTNLAMDLDGNLYVSDTGNFRVLKYDSEGELLQQFGSIGLTTGRFVRPKGVAVDVEGRLYVVDAATQVVQLFDPEGQLLTFFGGAGSQPGAMYLPAQVAIDYDNIDYFADYVAPGRELEYLVLVTNQYGPNKVSVYGFLKSDGRD